jgi:hypothetical protein
MQMRVSKGMGMSERKRKYKGRASDEGEAGGFHTKSASDESTIAR